MVPTPQTEVSFAALNLFLHLETPLKCVPRKQLTGSLVTHAVCRYETQGFLKCKEKRTFNSFPTAAQLIPFFSLLSISPLLETPLLLGSQTRKQQGQLLHHFLCQISQYFINNIDLATLEK